MRPEVAAAAYSRSDRFLFLFFKVRRWFSGRAIRSNRPRPDHEDRPPNMDIGRKSNRHSEKRENKFKTRKRKAFQPSRNRLFLDLTLPELRVNNSNLVTLAVWPSKLDSEVLPTSVGQLEKIVLNVSTLKMLPFYFLFFIYFLFCFCFTGQSLRWSSAFTICVTGPRFALSEWITDSFLLFFYSIRYHSSLGPTFLNLQKLKSSITDMNCRI